MSLQAVTAVPLCVAFIVLVGGCGGSSAPRATAASASAPPLANAAPPAAAARNEAISTDDLVRLARQHHPRAQLAAIETRASAAGVQAARAWANPELELEAGRSRGRGESNEADETVGRVELRQPLDWPGARSRRLAAAAAAGAAGEAGAALPLLELDAEVRATALRLRFAHQARALVQTALVSTREVLTTVSRRAAAGEASRGDALRVEIEVARLEQEVADHEREVADAHARLEAWCGRDLPAEVLLGEGLGAPLPPGSHSHPRLTHLDHVVRQRQAELALSRAAAVPAFSVGVYAGREADVDDLGVSLALSLPLWDRNQGGIALASAGIARAEAERAVARAEIEAAVAAAERDASRAAARAQRYREQILPKAREALRLALATYAGNESSLLDLLDALRTAHDLETDALVAERDAGLAVLAWRQALGTPPDLRGDSP